MSYTSPHLIFLLLALTGPQSNTQILHTPFVTTTYTSQDGLPHSYAYEILQDQRGYLWISTRYGISRFDGQNFVTATYKDEINNIPYGYLIADKDGKVCLLSDDQLYYLESDRKAVSNFNFNGNYPAEYSDFNLVGINIQDNLEAGVLIEDHESSLNHQASLNANVTNCRNNDCFKGIFVSNVNGSVTAHDIDFSDNSQYTIQAIKVKNQTPVVDATCNWYGHWSGPENTYYSGGLGSAVSGHKVTFAPWLTVGTDDDVAPGFQPGLGLLCCLFLCCG